jgi:hypothetical protein
VTTTNTRTKETSTQTNEPAQKPKKRARRQQRSVAPGKQKGSPEAKRAAAVVMEVLAGQITPTEAAGILGVSVMRYYVIESRALAGLVAGCEARPSGHPVDPERKVATLTRELESQRQATSRYQALARAAHRALGIVPPKPDASKKNGKGTKGRKRKPTVRALKAARGFRRNGAAADVEAHVPQAEKGESALAGGAAS